MKKLDSIITKCKEEDEKSDVGIKIVDSNNEETKILKNMNTAKDLIEEIAKLYYQNSLSFVRLEEVEAEEIVMKEKT